MISGTVNVQLLLGDGVCSCPGGPARWSLSQRLRLDRGVVRRAECLGCGRAWEKTLLWSGHGPEPTEDDWRAIPAVEVD